MPPHATAQRRLWDPAERDHQLMVETLRSMAPTVGCGTAAYLSVSSKKIRNRVTALTYDALASGDAVARFDALFAETRPKLLAICRGLVGVDSAEDIVHDAYERGRRRIGQLRDVGSFDAWIVSIAVNLCRDQHRRSTVRATHLRSAQDHGAVVCVRDPALIELIERLGPRDRTVLALHYGHGYGLNEIAVLLRLSHTNVRSIATRARRRLAKAWLEERQK